MKHYSYRFLLYLIGFLFIGSYIYGRFIFERTKKNLNIIKIQDNIFFIDINITLFFVIFFTISLIGFYIYLKKYYELPFKIYNNFFTRISLTFTFYLEEALLLIYQLMESMIPNSYENLKKVVLWFYNKYGHHERELNYIFYVIPYSLVGVFFVIDTLLFFEINYFYKILPIIAIPLLFKLWMFFIKELASNIQYIAEDLVIKHKFLEDGRDEFNFSVKPELNLDISQKNHILTVNVHEYCTLYPLKEFLDVMYQQESYYKIRALFFMYSCYLFSCIYILTLNIIYIYIHC